MSILEDGTGTPEFAHAMRGYDRFQVDEYIERLREWAAGSQARADNADRKLAEMSRVVADLRHQLQELRTEMPETPESAIADATDRASAAVTLALEEADAIRRRAADEADGLLANAHSQSLEIVEAARRSVQALTEAAASERRNAHSQAETLAGDAAREAGEVRRRAEDEALQLIGEAETEARRLIDKANEHAETVRVRADQEARESEDNLARLRADREQIVSELARLRGAIHTLLADPAADAEGGVLAPGQTEASLDTTVLGVAGSDDATTRMEIPPGS